MIGALLLLGGIPVAVIGIFFIVVSAIKKTNVKKGLRILGVGFAMFVIGLITTPTPEETNTKPIIKPESTIAKNQIEDTTEKEDDKASNLDDKNETVTEAAGKEEQPFYETATVTKVIDGDTIDVSIDGQTHRVRFILVDTPETKHPEKGVEFYGLEASKHTQTELESKTVYLEKDVSETDKYGRLLRYVWLMPPSSPSPSNEEIAKNCFNSLLLENGYAKIITFPPDVKYVDSFRTREQIARENQYGLWGQKEETAVGGVPSSGQKNEQNANGGYKDPKQPAYLYAEGKLIGNKNSKIYHSPGQQGYQKVAYKNAVFFDTHEQAQAAGYRAAKK